MGFYFLASIVGFLLIAHWAWRNDAVPPDGDTRGLFRMRPVNQTEGEANGGKASSVEIKRDQRARH